MRDWQKRLDKAAESLSARGVINIQSWLDKQVKLKRLEKDWLNVLEQMKTTLQEVYPNNWDIHVKLTFIPGESRRDRNPAYDEYWIMMQKVYNPNSDLTDTQRMDAMQLPIPPEAIETMRTPHKYKITFCPIIRYPEFTITNSQRKSQNIKDLFFKFEVRRDRKDVFQFIILEGIVTTVTEFHNAAGYHHSHLYRAAVHPTRADQDTRMNWRHFCTGGSGDVNTLAMDIGTGQFDVNKFTLFIMHLDTVAKYESLEGGPYYRMAEIQRPGERRLGHPGVSQTFIEAQLKEICESMVIRNLRPSWIIESNKPKIVDNSTFDRILRYKGEDWSQYNKSVICSEQGRYYYTPPPVDTDSLEEIPIPVSIKDKYIWFRGQQVKYKIIPNEQKTKTQKAKEAPFEIHPKFKEYVKSKLEKHAEYLVFRRNFDRWFESYTNNASTDTGEDTVSLPENQHRGVVGSDVLLSTRDNS